MEIYGIILIDQRAMCFKNGNIADKILKKSDRWDFHKATSGGFGFIGFPYKAA
jgi:hypothetical protein